MPTADPTSTDPASPEHETEEVVEEEIGEEIEEARSRWWALGYNKGIWEFFYLIPASDKEIWAQALNDRLEKRHNKKGKVDIRAAPRGLEARLGRRLSWAIMEVDITSFGDWCGVGIRHHATKVPHFFRSPRVIFCPLICLMTWFRKEDHDDEYTLGPASSDEEDEDLEEEGSAGGVVLSRWRRRISRRWKRRGSR